jgi:hypothetical protein
MSFLILSEPRLEFIRLVYNRITQRFLTQNFYSVLNTNLNAFFRLTLNPFSKKAFRPRP